MSFKLRFFAQRTMNYRTPGGDALGGGRVGLDSGGLVAAGEGGGSSMGVVRVGAGITGALLAFSFGLRFTFGAWLGSSVGDGDADALASGLEV